MGGRRRKEEEEKLIREGKEKESVAEYTRVVEAEKGDGGYKGGKSGCMGGEARLTGGGHIFN